MATIRQFSLFDMLHYNNINLDILTETFNSYFYAKYLIKWPEYCVSFWSATHTIQAYLIGKVQGEQAKKQWHGHVTAVTVAPQCRKQGFARLLMNYLERVSENHHGFFVDLFVRSTNNVAIDMYRKFGYEIYRTVNKYYSSSIDHTGEDAYGKIITQHMHRHEKVTLKRPSEGNIQTYKQDNRTQLVRMELIHMSMFKQQCIQEQIIMSQISNPMLSCLHHVRIMFVYRSWYQFYFESSM